MSGPGTRTRPVRRRTAVLAGALAAALTVVAGLVVALSGRTSDTAAEALWATTATPATASSQDGGSVELGVRFKAAVSGSVIGIQFYKSPDNTGTHTGSLWAIDGQRLATVAFAGETRSGWQAALFDRPVPITAHTTYVASYHAPNGRYADDPGYFRQPVHSGNLSAHRSWLLRQNGVRTYEPNRVPDRGGWRSANYWVTPLFAAGEAAPPATGGPAATRGVDVSDLPRVPWEGGPAYYAGFPAAAAWTDPGFFPVGVWFESVIEQKDVDADKGAGLNTYVELTDTSDMSLVRRNGMHAITNGPRPGYGAETVGWLLQDEADMWGGPGDDAWTGRLPGEGVICDPPEPEGKCGYTVLATMRDRTPGNDGRLHYANYGKGVIVWETDEEAERFVNLTSANSADVYWYTDPFACPGPGESDRFGTTPATCRLAANYGLTMDRMRGLDAKDGRRQPIYAFIEDGHPFTESDAPTITGDQLTGAVMSSLIHEARGIIYFNHNFGGPCISQHVLRDPCGAPARAAVTKVNEQIRHLAPVLNTQSYEYTFNPALSTMLKAAGGSYYVFAMLGRGTPPGEHALTLPPGLGGATAEVLFENRSVPVVDGRIADAFTAEYAYHIYKITP